MRRIVRLAATLTLLAFFVAPASADDLEELSRSFQLTEVISEGQYGCHRLTVFIAQTREQQIRGLMYVRELPDNFGMLFIYDRSAPRSMWMKNTYIPLDIAFIAADQTVINIARETTPFSLESIRSEKPARFSLELNAGAAERLGLRPGDRVHIPLKPAGEATNAS